MVAGLVQRRLADVFGVRFIRRTADGLHYRAYEEDALGQARLTLVRAGLPVCVRVDPASLEFTVVLRLSPLL